MNKATQKVMSLALSLTMVVGLMSGMAKPVTVSAANLIEGSVWTHSHDSWGQWDAKVTSTTVNSTAFDNMTVDISITGWEGLWQAPSTDAVNAGDYWGDNPNQLYSQAKIPVEPGKSYDISFDVKNNTMDEAKTQAREKNMTVTVSSGIDGDTDNTFIFETIRVAANGTYHYVNKVSVPEDYEQKYVCMKIAYGCYGYSFNAQKLGITEQVKNSPYCLAPGTTEDVNSSGTLEFTNIDFEGDYCELPEDTSVSKTTKFPSGYTAKDLVWADEFSGSTINTNSWNYEIGNGDWGWGNGEKQYYTGKTSNVYVADITDSVSGSVDNKAMAIRAQREDMGGCSYTSGRVQSSGKQSFKYGYMEAKIKMDNGMANGVWPAFWMLGETSNAWPLCGEWDIMEHANGNNYISSTLHWATGNGSAADYGSSLSFPTGDINDWHTYGMEWDKDLISMYLDGKKVVSMAANADTSELFTNSAFFIFNVAIGGSFIGNVEPNSAWKNSTMFVDYVRVFQKADTEGAVYTGTWQKDPYWKNYDYDNDMGGDYEEPVGEKDPVNNLSAWKHVHAAFETNDADINNTTQTELNTGFKANVSMTGWQGYWDAPVGYPNATAVAGYYGDNPFQLYSTSTSEVESGKTYTLGFDIDNSMKNADGTATEKNFTITVSSGVEGDIDNTFVNETIRVPASSSYTYTKEFTVPAEYALGTVEVKIGYGAYTYSFNANATGVTEQVKDNPYLLAPGTTEGANAKGRFTLKNAYLLEDPSTAVTEVEEDSSLYVRNWTHTHDQWGQWDAVIENTDVDDDTTGFTANISITGWEGFWKAPVDYPDAVEAAAYYGDNPFQLTSDADVEVEPGKTYTFKFDATNNMYAESGALTEKNVTVSVSSGIEGDTDNNFIYETIRIPAKSTLAFERTVTIPDTYTASTVHIKLGYGFYGYSYNAQKLGITDEVKDNPYLLAPGTNEAANCTGKLAFQNIMFTEEMEAPTLEVNGFQISPSTEGFRTIYSISNAKAAKKVGMIYGLAGTVNADDMIVGSTNSKVFTFDATSKGVMPESQSSIEGSTSYVMTMRYGTSSSAFLGRGLMVRAYAQLADGTYVYSDVQTTSIYSIANTLYTKSMMNTEAGHNYLYDNILKIVNPNAAVVKYDNI